MKKKKLVCVAALCAVFTVTGCGSAIPDMTNEQTHMVSEYAANLLLKYDANYQSRVVDTSAYHEELAKKAEEEAKKAAEEAAKKAEEEKKAEEAAKTEKSETEQVEIASSIEEFYQIAGVEINYSGFKVCDSYPEQAEEGEDMFFALGAVDGKKLLVMSFDVKNVSGAEMEFNMMDLNPRFKVSVNGGENRNVLFTMLPDDLAEYKGMLDADETVKAVVVAEIPSEDSENVGALVLNMKNGNDNAQLVLQ